MAGQPEKRSTLGHLLNVSMPFSTEKPVWRLICKGVSELTLKNLTQTLMNSSLFVRMLKLLFS